jgi:GntR family transcriptional regulator
MLKEGKNMKMLEKDSRIPLYYQLSDVLMEKIETGELGENDALSSERELCDKYDISRATVRQAMLELEKGGWIYKVKGKGTFVSPKKMEQELLKFYSFTGDMQKLGKVASTRVIGFEVLSCNSHIAKKMGIKDGDKIYKFARLRLADGMPMMIQNSYVPYNRFPGITRENLEEESMYHIFITRFNVSFTSGEEFFQVATIKEDEVDLLNIPKDSSGMMIERFSYENKKVIEYTVAIARGDRFKYHVILTN